MTDSIRRLNDALRTTFQGGRVMMTSTVAALPLPQQASILEAVRTFNSFNADNDPHREHDLGIVEVDGERFLWKLDYYDRAMEFGSDDPADPDKTTRVLTIMHASEY